MFLSELCDLLEVPRPDPAVPENAFNGYVFDRSPLRLKQLSPSRVGSRQGLLAETNRSKEVYLKDLEKK